jgi:hypothetical protein
LRAVRYPKSLVDFVARDPHNSVIFVSDNRHRVTPFARDFPVDEEVLELPAAAHTHRPESIARPAISYDQTSAAQICANQCRRTIGGTAHGCTHERLDRNDPRIGHNHLSRDRQRILEKVRSGRDAATGGSGRSTS